MSHKYSIIPIFVSHMGCPNDCVFCNQRQITGVDVAPTSCDIVNQVEHYLETIKAEVIEIAFYGGSFTGIESQIQETYLQIAQKYKLSGHVHRIRLSTRPDYIDDEILMRLKKYGVTTIELGVQSFDESVLLASKRGHSIEAIYKAVTLIKDYGFELGIQLMYGLPKDNFKKFFFSVEESIRLKADCVRLYPVLVIKNTELEALYLTKRYNPATLEDTIIAMGMAVKRYGESEIPVIRLGLQRTDLIDEGKEVVAGPFHPALKELVYDWLFFEALKPYLPGESDEAFTQTLELQVNPKQVTHILGHAKRNLKRCGNLKKVVIVQSSQIELNTFKLDDRQIISIMK